MSLNTILATAPLTTQNYHLKMIGTSIGNSLIWDNGTNVGIGNTNTSYTLDVSGSGRYNGSYAGHLLNVQNTNASYYSSTDYYDNAGTEKLIVGYGNASTGNALASKAIIYGTSGVGLNFYTNGSTTAKMVIDTSGNVGIGIVSPTSIGSGYTTVGINGVNGAGLTFNINGASANSYIYTATDGLNLINVSGSILFYNGGSERMRITSGGQLATTFNTSDNNAVFANINSNPYGPWIQFTTDPNNTTNYYLVCSALVAGIEYTKLKITSNGTVYNVTGTYTSGVSDIRYKEQIVDANSQWNDIKNLRVVNFKFIKDVEQNGDNALRQIGFIAQEVEKVSPNLIDEMSDEKTGETWKTIKASIIHTKAIKALQEAMTRIETLESTIQNLQEQINILAK